MRIERLFNGHHRPSTLQIVSQTGLERDSDYYAERPEMRACGGEFGAA